jgi:hypothetical protein
MMQHVAPVIVERVNRFFGYGAVARVTFKQGMVQLQKAKSRAAPPSLRAIGKAGTGLESAGPGVPVEFGDSLRQSPIPNCGRFSKLLHGALRQAKAARRT